MTTSLGRFAKQRVTFLWATGVTLAFSGALWAVPPGSPLSETNPAQAETTALPARAGEPVQPSAADLVSPQSNEAPSSNVAFVSGPDLIVGHVFRCEELGREGPLGSGAIGMSCWTTACNQGDASIDWIELPNIDHPVISVNLFRLRTVDGSDRLQQLGQSWVKHGFGTENANDCGFGCTGGDFSHDGPGCSDTYAASQFVPCDMGPRSMINPYTGVMPAGGNLGSFAECNNMYPSRDHRDHAHTQISHRLQVQDVDLIPSLNVGARYFSEGQYLTPHEFNAANGNQNNNVSYSRVRVDGGDACSGGFIFTDLSDAFAEQPAINAWPGASQTLVEPAPMADGRGFLVYKVTNLGGAWRYEYALYNMNMDRAMGSLSIPVPADVSVTHIGFHAPLNHAPEAHTENYSNTPWTVSTSGGAVTWSTDPFGVDPFANAVRWGTMYNFWFDASSPPQSTNATVGLFKTGGTVAVAVVGPSGVIDCNSNSIADRCDLDCGLPGCSVPGCGTKTDCDANGVPDDCEPDCNHNGIADRCDIASAFSQDCDADAVPDECEPFVDCNGNAIRDDCEIYADPSLDANNNGLPDECEASTGATFYVDDNAPNDPVPGSTAGSDPNEDGSLAHPFDAIQKAINVAAAGDTVLVLDGVYKGLGNNSLVLRGKAVSVRSENGPDNCVVDLENNNEFAVIEVSGPAMRIQGFHFANIPNGPDPAIRCFGSSPTIVGCKFTGAGPASNGVRLFQNSRPLITHCTFIGLRQAITCDASRPVISNCLITGGNNGIFASNGNGTMDCLGASSPRITNCTITGAAVGISGNADAFPIVENTIVWGNSSSQIAANSPITVSYSDVQGGWPGTGNIDANPLFVNAAGGDYRLAGGSRCIDAGNNAVAPLPATDLDGGPRLFDDPATPDTGAGTPPIIDLGVDEWADCNHNQIEDSQEVDQQPSLDCNRNRVPDECEPFRDCNNNSVRDICDISAGTSQDCNGNSVPDECDIAAGTSEDCGPNGIPDECEPDCNRNHVPDSCDISSGTSQDCDGNGVPNECDPDCQGNGIPDACDIVSGTSQDCNRNGVPDECDRAACAGFPSCADCNNNGILDVCDIASGAADCQPNGVPDVCELAGNDANGNGIPDECEPPGNIVWDADDLSTDRTTRSLRFRVEGKTDSLLKDAIRVELVELGHPNPRNAVATVALPTQTVPQNFAKFDTNLNGICSGATATPNYNGHPCRTDADCLCNTDSCSSADPARSGVCMGNPAPPLVACTAAGESVPANASGQGGCARWVGKPATFLEAQQVPGLGNYRAARLQCTPFYYDWKAETAGKVCAGPLGATNTGLPCATNSDCTPPATCVPKKITLVGAEILPSSTYSVRTYGSSCAGNEGSCSNLGTPVTMITRRHGDVASVFTPPDVGQPSSIDVSRIVDAFGKKGPLRKAHAKITPNLPEENLDVGSDDIGRVVDAAKGFAYPPIESGPCPCPPVHPISGLPLLCGATPCTCDAGPACVACGGVCVGGAIPGTPCTSSPQCFGGGTCGGAVGQCVRTCTGGVNDGLPCRDNDPLHNHCPGGTCGSGFCRDRCGRCTP